MTLPPPPPRGYLLCGFAVGRVGLGSSLFALLTASAAGEVVKLGWPKRTRDPVRRAVRRRKRWAAVRRLYARVRADAPGAHVELAAVAWDVWRLRRAVCRWTDGAGWGAWEATERAGGWVPTGRVAA